MDNDQPVDQPTEQTTREHEDSPVVAHRRAERMRTYTYHPRPEGRM